MTNYKSGFISVIGQPNVGKSTLINLFIGEKVTIISNKPQTTRNSIQCILTGEDYQAVFIDTPGIHKPKTKLGEYMLRSAETALDGMDIILYIVEPKLNRQNEALEILAKIGKTEAKVFLVINKTDTVEKGRLLEVIDYYRNQYNFAEIVPISALKADNTDSLLKQIINYLPEGPQYFPEDMITDQPEKQLAAEMIREKTLYFLRDEIPHGISVEITVMKERRGADIVDIDAVVYCEKDSHKGMVIGKNGEMLKNIGAKARIDIERMLGTRINLQLWVRVKKNWRDSDFLLRNFGYSSKTQ